MSNELQLDVCHVSRWRRHLVNTYGVKVGMVFIAGKTVWSMPECFKVVCIPCKALYKCSAFLCMLVRHRCLVLAAPDSWLIVLSPLMFRLFSETSCTSVWLSRKLIINIFLQWWIPLLQNRSTLCQSYVIDNKEYVYISSIIFT